MNEVQRQGFLKVFGRVFVIGPRLNLRGGSDDLVGRRMSIMDMSYFTDGDGSYPGLWRVEGIDLEWRENGFWCFGIDEVLSTCQEIGGKDE